MVLHTCVFCMYFLGTRYTVCFTRTFQHCITSQSVFTTNVIICILMLKYCQDFVYKKLFFKVCLWCVIELNRLFWNGWNQISYCICYITMHYKLCSNKKIWSFVILSNNFFWFYWEKNPCWSWFVIVFIISMVTHLQIFSLEAI